MDAPRDYHKGSKSDRERQILIPYNLTYIGFQDMTQMNISVAQTAKRLPAVQETRVQSLDREDPLEKEMAAHSGTLAWKIAWMEEPGRL